MFLGFWIRAKIQKIIAIQKLDVLAEKIFEMHATRSNARIKQKGKIRVGLFFCG